MHQPRTPVERVQAFRPPFCPWPECPDHRRRGRGYRFRRHATHPRGRGRRVPRFRCLRCLRTFSVQTFASSYYLKRPELLAPVAAGLVAGSAHRQIARSLGCAPSTVTRLAARLGRHAMLVQAAALAEIAGQIDESINLDHFETFELTQDFPFGIGTAVGARSRFTYTADPARHGRAGRVTPAQRLRLATRPMRERRGGYRASFARIGELVARLGQPGQRLRLVVDGRSNGFRALRPHVEAGRIRLAVYRNPERGPKGSPRSPEARARDAAMGPVDSLHTMLRHSMAHLRRETIAFGRRLNALMERAFVFLVWRNFIQGRSERKPDPTTPAMALGLAREPWTWRQLLSRRRFLGRERLPEVWLELYRRDWTTPLLPANTRHRLKHAV